jgi:hypothetical protein
MKMIDGADLNAQRATNAASPSSASDLATKSYVDNLVNGLAWKPSVKAASTANVTISNPGTAVFDGVTLSTNDRLLLKNQTTGSQNGPWVFNGSGVALTRPTDFAAGSTQQPNSTWYVSQGTVNADTAWTLTTDGTITVDTTTLAFAQVGGGTTYTANNGVQLTGTTFSAVADPTPATITVGSGGISVNRSKVPNYFSADIGDGTSTSITVNHALNNAWPLVVVYDKASKVAVLVSWTATDANNISVGPFPSAPTSAQYRVTVVG